MYRSETVEEGVTTVISPPVQPPCSMPQQRRAAHAYRNEELLNLTPVEVIKKLYDIAILAIKRDDSVLAQRAMTELIVGLNFEHKEIAVGLFRLYEYCKDCLRKGSNEEAVAILEELRETWAQAFHLH